MGIKTTQKRNVVVLTVLDDLVLDNILEMANTIDELLSQHKHNVVLDISSIEFITSRGLGAIGKGMDMLRRNGGDLKLSGTKPALTSILDICGLSAIIDMYDDEDSAVASFGATVSAVEKRMLWSITTNGKNKTT